MPVQKQERSRVSPLERARQLRAKADELEAQAAKQQRKDDARRKIIMGGAILAEAREDKAFAKQLGDILARRVTKPADQKAVAEWETSSI
jgi:hypothetical protein